jgi:hypothetical protein
VTELAGVLLELRQEDARRERDAGKLERRERVGESEGVEPRRECRAPR